MITSAVRRVAAMLALGAGALTAMAAEPTPTDSASAAVATVWADFLVPSLSSAYGDSAKSVAREYIEGVSEVIGTEKPSPRNRGRVEGLQLANRLAEIESMGIEIDREVFLARLLDAIEGRPTGFTHQSANEYMEYRLHSIPPVDPAYARTQAEFLTTNAAREGVITTSSGLLFEVILEGDGEMPQRTDQVRVNYSGRLSDGTEFDSTKGNPIVFGVSQLVPGFTEGLLMMRPGGTYRMIIPAALAYGERGAGGVIPPGAALDFTVELLEVIK